MRKQAQIGINTHMRCKWAIHHKFCQKVALSPIFWRSLCFDVYLFYRKGPC